MRKQLLLSLLLLFLFAIPAARGGEISELKQQLAEQQQLLLKLQQKIEQMESQQQQQLNAQIEQKVSETVEKKGTPENLKWAEKIKISGDFRYRHESIDEQNAGTDDWKSGNNRHRIRVRLGLDAKVDENWDLGFRLASGTGDPSTTNQTLENGFSKKDVWIDLAYFNWHPKSLTGLNAFGGKMPNPFFIAGGNQNQLIWDEDLTPEGLAAQYVLPLGGSDKLNFRGGGFWLAEDSSTSDGVGLWGAQTYIEHTFENKDSLSAGVSFYDFANIQGKSGLYRAFTTGSLTKKTFGNTMNGTGADIDHPLQYTMDYDVLEGFGEYNFKVCDLPSALFGNYINNTAAENSKDTGWLAGLRLNKVKDAGSWQLGYWYRDIDADATIGVLNDSDFIGGGTNGKGHTFNGRYQFTKNVQGSLTYFLNEKGTADDDYRRLQADIVVRF